MLPFWAVAFSGRCLSKRLPFRAVTFLGRCLLGRCLSGRCLRGLNRSFIIYFSLGDHRSQITQFCGHEPVCRQFSNPIGCKTFKSWTFQPIDIIRNHSNRNHSNSGLFNPGLFNPGLFNPRCFNHEFFNPRLFNHELFNHELFNLRLFKTT